MKALGAFLGVLAPLLTIASIFIRLRWHKAKMDQAAPPSPWTRRLALGWLILIGFTATIVFCVWVVKVSSDLLL